VTVTIRIEIPAWLERLIVPLVLLYRRLRFGYAFRRIPLTQGLYALVDPADYADLSRYRWHANRGRDTFYAQRKVWDPLTKTERTVKMHRQILNCPDHLVVDHVNHCGLDNRRANIRAATAAQNVCNVRPPKGAKSAARHLKQVGLAPPRKSRRARKKKDGKINHPASTLPDQLRGVSFHKHRRKYYARVRVHGRTIRLGYFDDPVEAAKARDAAALEHHGPFATLNFPHLRLIALRARITIKTTARGTLTVIHRSAGAEVDESKGGKVDE
jgi:hypothetical protein